MPVGVSVCGWQGGKGWRCCGSKSACTIASLRDWGASAGRCNAVAQAEFPLLLPAVPCCALLRPLCSTWTCPPTSPPSRPTPTQVRIAACLCGCAAVCGCVDALPRLHPRAHHEQHALKKVSIAGPLPAAPTLADLDNDGKLEVMLGTSMVSRVGLLAGWAAAGWAAAGECAKLHPASCPTYGLAACHQCLPCPALAPRLASCLVPACLPACLPARPPACLQGFLYALDCYGVTLPGFPLQMGDIQVGEWFYS